MTDLYDYHNGPNLGLEPTTPSPEPPAATKADDAQPGYAGVTVWVGDMKCTMAVPKQILKASRCDELLECFQKARRAIDAAQAQPKRRPYNASGSLSEYGVFPECDAAPAAQSPAKGADVALPHPLGIVDPDPTAPRVYTVQDLANYARAAVLADRQQRGGDVVSAFDAAVAAELPKVSTLEYNSNEICKHFAERIRAALSAQPAASAPVAAQAPQDEPPADILPPPGIHTAVHYAGWLRREAHRHQEPKASVLRQAARMLDVLKAECGRLHQELIDSQAPTANADARDAARYRLLRKGAVDDVAVVRGLGAMDYGMSAVAYTYSEEIDGDDLDAAIGTAMRKEGK